MVTYKWPSWLHRQTEKQRIIWAYKILFLDVLFPLNVSRIIFCDSDQIIRTDLVRFCKDPQHCYPVPAVDSTTSSQPLLTIRVELIHHQVIA